MLVVFRAMPRHALADIHVKRAGRDRPVECFLGLFAPAGLAKRRGKPAIDQREIGIGLGKSCCDGFSGSSGCPNPAVRRLGFN